MRERWRKIRSTPIEVFFVRAVTAVLFCIVSSFPLTPIYLWMRGWIPMRMKGVALALGMWMVLLAPLAAPQNAQPQVTVNDLQRLDRTDEKLRDIIENNQAAIIALDKQVYQNGVNDKQLEAVVAANKEILQDISRKFDRAMWVFIGATGLLGLLIRYKGSFGDLLKRLFGNTVSILAFIGSVLGSIRHKF